MLALTSLLFAAGGADEPVGDGETGTVDFTLAVPKGSRKNYFPFSLGVRV